MKQVLLMSGIAIIAMIFIVAIMSLVNRSGEKNVSNSKVTLIGKWDLVKGKKLNNEILELLNDGTGIIGNNGITWKTVKNRLYINYTSGKAFSYDYELSSSFLLLTGDRDNNLKYIKSSNFANDYLDSKLYGEWKQLGKNEIYDEYIKFSNDGVGDTKKVYKDRYGSIGFGSLTWKTYNGLLFIDNTVEFQEYKYVISNSNLILTDDNGREIMFEVNKTPVNLRSPLEEAIGLDITRINNVGEKVIPERVVESVREVIERSERPR